MIFYDNTAIEAVNQGRETPDAFYAKSTLIATSHWVKTDAWRGYSEVRPEPGYKEIAGDWVTGDWSDAPAGNSSSEVKAKIKELEAEHGDIYVIFTPTSNVFSTAWTVIVRDKTVPINRGKTIAHKTKLFSEPNGDWRVRYHATDVVSYNAKTDKYTLNTGGWNTMTTSKRMTAALPNGWYVYRRNWVMYLHRPDVEQADIEITDGMEV